MGAARELKEQQQAAPPLLWSVGSALRDVALCSFHAGSPSLAPSPLPSTPRPPPSCAQGRAALPPSGARGRWCRLWGLWRRCS